MVLFSLEHMLPHFGNVKLSPLPSPKRKT